MRLYFFPALIPLGSLFAGLLTLTGTVAGVALRFWKHRLAHLQLARRREARAYAFSTAFLGLALWIFQALPHPESVDGSRLIPPRMHSRITIEERGDSPAEKTPTSSPAASSLSEQWLSLSSRMLLSTPAITEDLVLIGTRSGTLEAYSRKDHGRLVFTLHKREPIFSRPVVNGEIAFIGEGLHTAAESRLTAVHLRKKRVLWEREFLGHLETAPLIDPRRDRLYVSGGPSGLWAVRASDGRMLWNAPIGHVDSTPVLADDLLISPAAVEGAKTPLTQLIAMNPTTAEAKWKCPLPGQPWGSPLLDPVSGDILVTTALGRLEEPLKSDRGWSHAIDPKTGRLRWTQELPAMPLLTSAIIPAAEPGENLLLHTLKNGELIALRLGDRPGTHAWSASVKGPVFAPATVLGTDRIAVITQKGELNIRDARTGKEIEKLEVGPMGTSSAVALGTDLVVPTPEALTSYRIKNQKTPLVETRPAPETEASAQESARSPAEEDDPEDEPLPEIGD